MALDMVSYNAGTFSNFSGGSYQTVVPPLAFQFPETVIASGFSALPLTPGNTKYYVSNVDGDDSNDGLTEGAPFATRAKLVSVLEPSDHVYFKFGETWDLNGSTPMVYKLDQLSDGVSLADPTVIRAYGNPLLGRPVFENGFVSTSQARHIIHNYIYKDIAFYNPEHDPSSPRYLQGVDVGFLFLGGNEGIAFEDCKFTYVEVAFQFWDSLPARDITFRRCIHNRNVKQDAAINFHERSSLLYLEKVVNLTVEQCVGFYGGWDDNLVDSGRNQFSHNWYIQSTDDGTSEVGNSIRFHLNFSLDASSHGVHGRPGGLYENNFMGRCPIGMQTGYNSQALEEDSFAVLRDNVITEGVSMYEGVDSQFQDKAYVDSFEARTTAVYGAHIDNADTGHFLVDGNIITQRYRLVEEWYPGLNVQSINVEQWTGALGSNIEYKYETASQGVGPNYTDPDRTLGTYYDDVLVGSKLAQLVADGYVDVSHTTGAKDSFTNVAEILTNRNAGSWDDALDTLTVNQYIRDGFTVI